MSRAKIALAGTLYWLVFGIGTLLVVLVGQPVLIIVYACTGSAEARDWVYSTGKAADQINNAAWFSGHPKETISSSAGRWIASGKPLPRWVKIIRILTDLFEKDHCLKAIEDPFKDFPLS